MKNTRLMDRLFSSTSEKDEELNQQVANDIEEAKKNGEVDTDELKFKDEGNGTVSILDKENGETTMAEKVEGEDVYDLYPAEYNPTEQPEKFNHPEEDGVTPGDQQGAPDEDVKNHLEGQNISDNEPVSVEETAQEGPTEEVCPECGKEPCECEKPEKEEKSFCDSTNAVVQRIYSDQEFCERIFSEVIESEETAKVGDLKVEKVGGQENTVIVTSESTGDQAEVVMDDDEMKVTELDSKSFSEYGEDDPEQFNQIHVVGCDVDNHVIVDSPTYSEEDAQALAEQLAQDGVSNIQIIDNFEDARDYAIELLEGLGAQHEDQLDIEEPEEVTYCDHTVYLTKYYSNHTCFMERLYSEHCDGIDCSKEKLEDAIGNGDEIETETEIITPIDSKTAIVQDKDSDEYTKVVIENDNMNLNKINEDEAVELMQDIEVEDTDEDEDQKEYSDIWCNEAETKFFSENELMTDFMCRLFSEEADEEKIVEVIKDGDPKETETEIITPVDEKTAIIEDKSNGEFTLAKLDEDEDLDIKAISKEEAADMNANLKVDEKEYSDVWCNEAETKFFSESETMNNYMTRLFSDEADEKEIEKAIETGEQINSGTDVITPVDDKTAVIEDTANNEFTKATMDDEKLDVQDITKEEANDLIGKPAEEDKKEDEEEKTYSTGNPILDKFFADVMAGNTPADDIIPARIDPNTGELVPVEDPNAAEDQPQMTVEAIEDKALAAVQSIQAAAAEAEATIMNAKAAPAETEQANLQEAQFSEKTNEETETQKTFSNTNDTLVSWLSCH